MVKLALLFLLLPLAQEDPQVVYREGLFEEVDQGNLEKAAELYAKVLKSGAPDALKAKALLRTGFCHEKKGRKKEAEQAWRDVIERYPDTGETAKLARERLALLSTGENSGPISLDAQIQILVLDLGSTVKDTRQAAIRRLMLLGEPAIPELRKALRHKDALMCLGAARALADMGEIDGLYEAIRPHLGSEISSLDSVVLQTLLEKRKEDRAKFLGDVDKFANTNLIAHLSSFLCGLEHPAFPKLVEDWLVNPKLSNSLSFAAYTNWIEKAGEPGLIRLIDRCASGEKPQYSKVHTLAGRSYGDAEMTPDLQAALIRALERAPEPASYLIVEKGAISYMMFQNWMRYLDEGTFVRQVLPAWIGRSDDKLKWGIITALMRVPVQNESKIYWQGSSMRAYLYDLLASPKIPLEARAVALKEVYPGNAAEREKHLSLCLDYWRARKNDSKESDATIEGVIRSLANQLPPDSQDLPGVLDSFVEMRMSSQQFLAIARAKEIRGPLVAAALRHVKPESPLLHIVLDIIGELATPQERVELGRLIASWPPEKLGPELAPSRPGESAGLKAIAQYCHGVMMLPERDRLPAWKELMAFYAKLRGQPKVRLVQGLAGWDDARVDEFMKEAYSSSSDSEPIRTWVVTHWRARDAKVAIAPLIQALEDNSQEVRRQAAEALGKHQALEAVPALIPLLEGEPGEVREAAATALAAIRTHYEERAQWQRWYDDVKKTLKK